MKQISIVFTFLFMFCNTHGQNATEAEIRKLDSAQKEVYFKKDTSNFLKYFSADVIVHGPSNNIETLEELLVRIRRGGSNREYYDRVVEKVSFYDNIAIM